MWNLHNHKLFKRNSFNVWVNISFGDCKLAVIRRGGGGVGESKTGRSVVILKNAFMTRWLAIHAEKKLKSRGTKEGA